MRIYITYSETATTTPAFPRRGIASRTGRLDVIARMLRASLWTPAGPRSDTVFIAVLEGPPQPPLALTFRGELIDCEMKYETDAVECIRKCMREELRGCKKEKARLYDVLKSVGVPIVLLSEDGEDISKVEVPKSVAFLLGSQHDLEVPPRIPIWRKISIGPFSYLASHCISYLQYYLDLRASKEIQPTPHLS